MKSPNNFLNVGEGIECDRTTIFFPPPWASDKPFKIKLSTLSKVSSFPSSFGCFTLSLSYNERTAACVLALVLPKSFARGFGSILIGRPSLVLTKTLAKS